jgi:hypothetical protein
MVKEVHVPAISYVFVIPRQIVLSESWLSTQGNHALFFSLVAMAHQSEYRDFLTSMRA